MSFRFLKIQATGETYIDAFLRQHPEYSTLSYNELYDLFLRSCVGWNTYYSRPLAALGNETMDVCIDFEFLQKFWAREHNVKYNDPNWLREIVSAQLKAFQPDIVFIDDLYYFDVPYRQFLRDAAAKPFKLVGWRAAPTTEHEVFSDVDLMLTCTPLFVDQLRRNGATADLMLHAFEPQILDLLNPLPKRDLDFTFVGNFVLRNGFHNERLALVKALLDSTNIEVWGNISEPRKQTLTTRIIRKLVGDRPYTGPQASALLQTYPNRFHDPVLALEYFKVLARS